MDGTVDWWAAKFGILLGYGFLLVYYGLRAVIDKSLKDRACHRGMWKKIGGNTLTAISMLGITPFGFA